MALARDAAGELDATGAEVIVTSCPLCKKALARGTRRAVRDLSEVVADSIADRVRDRAGGQA